MRKRTKRRLLHLWRAATAALFFEACWRLLCRLNHWQNEPHAIGYDPRYPWGKS